MTCRPKLASFNYRPRGSRARLLDRVAAAMSTGAGDLA